MRVLWHSNAVWSPSGYGNQTDLFARLLKDDGHQVIVSAFYGLQGGKLNLDGIEVLPGSYEQYGGDALEPHVAFYQPDVLVMLIDVWVFPQELLARLPVTSWCPIDHEPPPPAALQSLHGCQHIMAMSRFGERQLRQHGLDPWYVPHGVDCDLFRPQDQRRARQQLGLPEDAFVALFVGANKGFPMRKNPDVLLKAWSRFVQSHPKSILWMHTVPFPVYGGLDLHQVVEFYGLSPDNVQFSDAYRMMRGDYGGMALNAMYNAADIFVLPSAGGGFEIPLIEAQAAGCPVVTVGFSAMQELVGAGYTIPIDPFADTKLTAQMSEQANVRPDQVLVGLEWAWEQRGNERLRQQARDFAIQYDAQTVYQRYLKPALEAQAEFNRLTGLVNPAKAGG